MEQENSSGGAMTAQGVMDRVRSAATTQLTTQKSRATDTIGSLATAMRGTTNTFREQKQDVVAQYVERAAEQLDRFSSHLREREVTDLLDDAGRFARRQPALFIGAAFAAGVIAARFLKSSAENQQTTTRSWQQFGTPEDRFRTSAGGSTTAHGSTGGTPRYTGGA